MLPSNLNNGIIILYNYNISMQDKHFCYVH